MNNRIYWEQREKLKLDNSLKDVDKLEKLLEKEYKKASKEIEKEIALLFNRYATENKLSYAEASKYLNSNEFKEWRYDLKEYMTLIKQSGDEKLLLELNTLAMKSRISRLDSLKYQVDKYINNLYGDTLESTTGLLSDTFTDNYYKTIYDVHKFVGVGSSFALVDDDLIKSVLSYPWSGENYSTRIWNNRDKLKSIVRSEITQMVVRGEASRTISKRVAEKMDTSLFNARRLINTEHSYVMSEATCKAFEELDIEKYEFLATLDNRTSVICQSLDGKVFNLKDRVVGVNASPLHCFCRSTELPVIDDNYVSTRIARDKNGQNIEVPSDMTYNQWHDEFVKGVKSDYKPKEKKVEKVIKDVKHKLSDFDYLENKYGIKTNVTDRAKEVFDTLPKEFFEALNTHIDDLYTKYPKLQGESQRMNKIEFDIYKRSIGLASYGYNSNSMTINLSSIKETLEYTDDAKELYLDYRKLVTSSIHEIGHYVDNMITRTTDKSMAKWNTDKDGNFTSYYDGKEYSMKKLKGQLKKKGWTLSKKERYKELGDYAETDLAEMMAEGWGYTKAGELMPKEWLNTAGVMSKHLYDSKLGKDIVEIYEELLDNHFK